MCEIYGNESNDLKDKLNEVVARIPPVLLQIQREEFEDELKELQC